MDSQKVTTKDGREVTVYASKDEMKSAVQAAKDNNGVAEGFDINVPVKKGHDLLTYGTDLMVETVDGTGAHNSPRTAIRDDGSVEGSDPLLVTPSADAARVYNADVKELVSDGNLKDVDVSEVETVSDKVGSKASKQA